MLAAIDSASLKERQNWGVVIVEVELLPVEMVKADLITS